MRGGSSARLWIARLTVFLFALQAALPIGFMPDPEALKSGHYEIVICTGTGLKTITVDEQGKPVDSDDTDGTHSGAFACPFSKVAAKAAALPPAPVLDRLAAAVIVPLARDGQAPVQDARGPALGSRAPPVILG